MNPASDQKRIAFGYNREYGRIVINKGQAAKEMGVQSPRGNPTWSIETIRKILNNEKYYGNVLLQKTYISHYFTGKQAVNNG